MSAAHFPKRIPQSVKLRPERSYVAHTWLDILFRQLKRLFVRPLLSLLMPERFTVRRILRRANALEAMDEPAFQAHIANVRARLIKEGVHKALIQESFATIREASGRSLGMRHHHTQIRASLILLRGAIAEMATGEGKTLAGTLASITAAMAGIKVHVITTNDYLAARDCEEMQPLFSYMAVNACAITNDSDREARQQAYQSDIMYCSNNELVFDYLKDSLVLGDRKCTGDLFSDVIVGDRNESGNLMMQGLVFAIVDEADSVFIDESRTPLVISGGDVAMADEEAFLRSILEVAGQLIENRHYRIDQKNNRILLTERGKEAVEEISLDIGSNWLNLIRREQMMAQALTALHLFHRDKHYLVQEEKIVIVDEYTGRPSGDRSWEGGLHQLIEIKEDCPLSKPKKTLAKISYQNFFRKYHFLSGMTGTGAEVRKELLSVYSLTVESVPLLQKSKRRMLATRVLKNQQQKLEAIVEAACTQASLGRAVLVGAASVKQSEAIAGLLIERQIAYELLTAKQDEEEAEIVARAGTAGKITIATSMAGRGTDIKLEASVKAAGGLHVIIGELHDSARVDRQLAGRCARQGDPGSVEFILSMEDPLIQMFAPVTGAQMAGLLGWWPGLLSLCGKWLHRYCQLRIEMKHARERKMTLKNDQKERSTLAFLDGGKWH